MGNRVSLECGASVQVGTNGAFHSILVTANLGSFSTWKFCLGMVLKALPLGQFPGGLSHQTPPELRFLSTVTTGMKTIRGSWYP